MGWLDKISKNISEGLNIADEAVTDKDELNKLKHTLTKARMELLYKGKGASITKITICILVSIVVCMGTLVFTLQSLTGQLESGTMEAFKDYALAVTPILGILVGSYAGGSSFKKLMERNND